MRINISKTKNHEFVYVIKDIYNNKSRTTKIYKKLGRLNDLCKEKNMSRDEVIAWAKEYAKQLTQQELDENRDTIIPFSPTRIIDRDVDRRFNCGYLFLQNLYYQLRLQNICRNIRNKHKFDYDINAILSDLVYARILRPGSKRSSYDFASVLLEKPGYELHDVYRALSVLAEESDYIQAELYKNSHFIKKRNTSTLYYDCTNYYFEIEEDDDFRKYGKSKENRPNPIIGMGLMMDGDGIPLAFDMYEGNKNEQTTLKPLEKRIIKDFQLSQFIYCSDAGLSSKKNKEFNNIQNRAYIITQSLKKLKKDDKEVALKHTGFYEVGIDNGQRINLDDIDFNDEKNINRLFYKELPIEDPVKERLIITFSPKYAIYQKNIRKKQIQRAQNMIKDNGKLKKNRKNPNDPARFIEEITTDQNGEIIEIIMYWIWKKSMMKKCMMDYMVSLQTLKMIILVRSLKYQKEDGK